MTLQDYLRIKEQRVLLEKQPRSRCYHCRKPAATCYCAQVKPFESSPRFAILIHRDEVRRSIATGRMAHLCLRNSLFFEGTDFSEHVGVNQVLSDARNFCVLLYPGKNSTPLSRANAEDFCRATPQGKQLIIFVIDGTWAQARRIKRLSKNLARLPEISFLPETPSRFLVRQQPEEYCYSTIESVHTMIDWMQPDPERRHENLLEVFSFMVNQQVEYEMHYGALRGFVPTRGHRFSGS